MEYMLLALHSDATDTWPTRVFVSDRMKVAVENLLKQTEDTLALKLQGFIISGVTGKHSKFYPVRLATYLASHGLGAIKATNDNALATLRTMIRNDVNKGLGMFCVNVSSLSFMLTHNTEDVLTEKRGVARNEVPRMEWARHEKLVVAFGVELKGWPEPGGVCNPSKLTSTARLMRLKNALDSGECHWIVLSDEEWTARKEAAAAAAAANKGKGRASADNMDTDEDDSEDVNGEDRGGDASALTVAPSLYPPGLVPSYQPFNFNAFNHFDSSITVDPSFQPELDPNLPSWEPTDFQFMQGSSQGLGWA